MGNTVVAALPRRKRKHRKAHGVVLCLIPLGTGTAKPERAAAQPADGQREAPEQASWEEGAGQLLATTGYNPASSL